MKRVIHKLKRIGVLFKLMFSKEESDVLKLIQYEAENYLSMCRRLGIRDTEEIEDLLFHVQNYFDIPDGVRVTMFSEEKKKDLKDNIAYLEEVEKQRAVERFCICEHLKTLPMCFII